MKQGFKGATSWKKYISEITTQIKNNNLNYMIDPTFRNINRLFVPSFGIEDIFSRNSFDRYYIPLIETFLQILMC